MRAEPSASAGFTLLEVMVAFVIAALALGVLLGGAVSGLRAAQLAGRYEEALSRAQSHMAALGREAGLVAGTRSGADGGIYRWRTDVRRLATAPPLPTGDGALPATQPALFALTVAISWPSGGGTREVVLRTERVGAVALAR